MIFSRFCDINQCYLSIHYMNSTPKDQPRKYDCVLCKKEFDCAQSRKEHVGSHADPITGRFSCNRCRKTFVEFTALRKHIRAFHSDRQYPCSVCQKVTSFNHITLQIFFLCLFMLLILIVFSQHFYPGFPQTRQTETSHASSFRPPRIPLSNMWKTIQTQGQTERTYAADAWAR